MARAPKDDLVDEIGSERAPTPGPARVNRKTDGKEEGSGKQKRSAGYYTMVLSLSCLTCLLFYETVILMAVGMLPTGVAYLIDTHPRRYASKTVAWTNLAGALIIAFELWGSDRSLATTLDLLQEPTNWVVMLGAAGVGWGIHFMVPGMVLRYLDISFEMRRKTLKESQKELEKEWGVDVRKSAPLDELAVVEAGPITDEDEDEDEEQKPAEEDPAEADRNGTGG